MKIKHITIILIFFSFIAIIFPNKTILANPFNTIDNAEIVQTFGQLAPVNHWSITDTTSSSGIPWKIGPHKGIDYRVVDGTEVHVVESGKVVAKIGNTLYISHYSGNIYTTYAHIDVNTALGTGDIVQVGDIVGTVQNYYPPPNFDPYWNHLHFEIKRQWNPPIYENPMNWSTIGTGLSGLTDNVSPVIRDTEIIGKFTQGNTVKVRVNVDDGFDNQDVENCGIYSMKLKAKYDASGFKTVDEFQFDEITAADTISTGQAYIRYMPLQSS